MTIASTLVKDLKAQVAALEKDLRQRSDDPSDVWGQQLKTEYRLATERGRTGFTWSEWRDGEVSLAAVAWVLGTVFIRFCEDNALIDGAWITGEGDRYARATDNETAFYQDKPSRNARDWLRASFSALVNLPAGRDIVDPRHNLVWRAPISADAAANLLTFWRTQDADGSLVHDFTDPELDTRFLGDLYQDLSEFAKKKYALLQTPIFVEEFILDRTLTPAIAEFGLEDLRLIDPTCGSGHFLLGAFDRLLDAWLQHAPALDRRERVQKALDSINGVDLNPFAVAIARFRLTVAALKASGITRLKDAPAFAYRLAVGDSLLYGFAGTQGDLLQMLDKDESFTYANEDVAEHPHILDRGTYHVVVGNPPYITVKDKALNEAYRAAYKTCHRQYALSVPFMELFFELTKKGEADSPAGYVGQITSNSFMKREFGSKVIETLLSGNDLGNPVDLTNVIDTSGAYIPGHGTPTVILIGRRRRPVGTTLRAVLGVRGEPGQPVDAAKGLVWTQIVGHLDDETFNGEYVTVTGLERSSLAAHPWSLSGGGAADVKGSIERGSARLLLDVAQEIGFGGVTREDSAYVVGLSTLRRRGVPATHIRPLVEGEFLRDYALSADVLEGAWPYEPTSLEAEIDPAMQTFLWPYKPILTGRVAYGLTQLQRGLEWFEYSMFFKDRYRIPLSLTFAFVATHNHFVLDRGGKVFNRSAPVIKLPAEATEDEYLDLLGVLNSSVTCFWLRQACYNKGGGGSEPWEARYEFTGTKLQEFPLPSVLPRERARRLDALAQESALALPSAVLGGDEVSQDVLAIAHGRWVEARERMVFAQEELDWDIYRSYGLIDEDLTYPGSAIERIEFGQRAFELALARSVESGAKTTAWFDRHGSTAITEFPASWPSDYAALVQRRLDLIALDPFIGLLERPEFKRRWATASWESMQAEALQTFVLDRLEATSLWSDASGPHVLSVAQLADRVKADTDLVEGLRLLAGAVDVDVASELGKLVASQAVPFLAAYRYKDSGMRTRAEWESVWDLQRREDAGEQVSIPVPPKYKPTDFKKTSYWQARGKLDVPKERFILYPGAGRSGDGSAVLGWAGWDHLEQARALATMIVDRSLNESWSNEQLLPLVAGLVELEPWLHQWHADPDPLFNGSPAVFITGFIDQHLSGMGKTRDDCKAWRPL